MQRLMTPDLDVLGRGIEDGVAGFLKAATGAWPVSTHDDQD
jgi:hypothetical protein